MNFWSTIVKIFALASIVGSLAINGEWKFKLVGCFLLLAGGDMLAHHVRDFYNKEISKFDFKMTDAPTQYFLITAVRLVFDIIAIGLGFYFLTRA